MNAKDLYVELLANLQRVLGPEGFAGKGPIYTRRYDEVAHLIGVQKSDASSGDRLKFTLNIGIWSKDVSVAMGKGEKAPGSVGRCQTEFRIGNAKALNNDTWWNVYDEGDLISACAQVEALLRGYVFPMIASVTSAEDLNWQWQEGKIPVLKAGFIGRDQHKQLLAEAVARKSIAN